MRWGTLLVREAKKPVGVLPELRRGRFGIHVQHFCEAQTCFGQVFGHIALALLPGWNHKRTLRFDKNSVNGQFRNRLVEVASVLLCKVSGKGKVQVQLFGFPGVSGILRIAMQHSPPGWQPIAEYLQHIVTRIPVMDYYRHIELGGKVKLRNK